MKVWVVTYDAYGNHHVSGVYTSAEAAKASVTPHRPFGSEPAEWRSLGDDDWWGGEYNVEAFEVEGSVQAP